MGGGHSIAALFVSAAVYETIHKVEQLDGFLLPVPKKKLDVYRRIARKAGRVWREHGAVEYRECVGDDLKVKMGVPFTRLVRLKPGETVVFSWIVYKSRAHRDRVNAKVMKDPRLAKMMDPKSMPFDMKRMAYGGFKILVDAADSSGDKVHGGRSIAPCLLVATCNGQWP